MPRTRLVACTAALALALGACAQSEEELPQAPDEGVPAETEKPGTEPGTVLPPEGDMFRFVGRWAESVEMCREEPWTITSNRLTAPDEVACDLTRIEKSPGGYAIDARCTIEGETEDDNMVLRFAESAKAMLVEGASTLPDTGLVYCGEVEEQAEAG